MKDLDLSKQFEYQKLVREIDQCYDIDQLKQLFKEWLEVQFKKDKVMQDMLLDTMKDLYTDYNQWDSE